MCASEASICAWTTRRTRRPMHRARKLRVQAGGPAAARRCRAETSGRGCASPTSSRCARCGTRTSRTCSSAAGRSCRKALPRPIYTVAPWRSSPQKNPGCVRLRGTVLEETQNTFRIITSDNRIKVLPKESSMFEVAVLGERVRLLGPAWAFRLPKGAPGPRAPQAWSLG
mmetsp:Transcript_130491/g.418397  ORF Transcript_130491/g.418397 Transcript_130491/m.418397 type:complete len:170 (+) Transcript_130491:277-786(+)